MNQVDKEVDNARLPGNKQEESELEKLAVQGPSAVCAWIYGKDSSFAKKTKDMTWKDLDSETPIAGCRKLVKEAKFLKEFDPQKFNKDLQARIAQIATAETQRPLRAELNRP